MSNSYTPFKEYPDVLNVEQMQSALGIGRSTAYKLIKNNEIGYIRVGRSIRVPRRCLIDYTEQTCDTVHSNGGQNVLVCHDQGGNHDSKSAK